MSLTTYFKRYIYKMTYLSYSVKLALLLGTLSSQIQSFDTYQWIADDNFFDCVVGINVNGRSAGMGVFIKWSIIVASESPLQGNGWTHFFGNKPGHALEVYAINRAWNREIRVDVDRITGNQNNRGNVWVKVGFNKRHSPIYDFLTITCKGVKIFDEPHPNRLPWATIFLRTNYSFFSDRFVEHPRLYNPYEWKFAAFGYVNEDHIRGSYELMSTYYSEDPLEDCDEWIPRRWGHFICINNVDNFFGIQNGAALFNGNYLVGLGAFELNKGNESILVFTDMVTYKKYLHVNFTPVSSTPDYVSSTPDP